MARPNKMEKRPARLQCSKHDEHQYVDYSVPQVGLYVAKQEQVKPTCVAGSVAPLAGDLCRKLHPIFREDLFHALGWIRARGRGGATKTPPLPTLNSLRL